MALYCRVKALLTLESNCRYVLFASPLQKANARPGSLAVPEPIMASKSSLPRWYLHQALHIYT